MKVIQYGSLFEGKLIGEGSFSTVYLAEYKSKKYALKIFDNPEDFFIYGFQKRLDVLLECKLKRSIVPKYIVSCDKEKIGYITDYSPFKTILDIDSLEDKYNALLCIKNSILELHKNNIVHADVHGGNMIGIDNKWYLIDFDNCDVLDSEFSHFSKYIASRPATDFYNRKGLVKDLDIFLHNLLTFTLLNDGYTIRNISQSYGETRASIRRGNYGIFSSNDSIRLCKDIFRFVGDDFLIDTVDISYVKSLGERKNGKSKHS